MDTDTDGGSSCAIALAAALARKDAVSAGEVRIVSEAQTERTLFIDAAAGGSAAALMNPRIYLRLCWWIKWNSRQRCPVLRKPFRCQTRTPRPLSFWWDS